MRNFKKIAIGILSIIIGATSLVGCGSKDKIINDGSTVNIRLYKGGYGVEWIYELKDKFEQVYEEEGYKVNILNPTYDIKVCFSDTPRNATQSDLKVVLPEEYKEPIRVEYGDTIKGGLPKGEPLNKDDYKFDKWVTYIDGKEVTITDATVFGKSDFSGIQGGEIIIYPVLKNLWVGPF